MVRDPLNFNTKEPFPQSHAGEAETAAARNKAAAAQAHLEAALRPEAWKRAPPGELLKKAIDGLAPYGFNSGRFNVAFVGPSGSGKSSSFNAVCKAFAVNLPAIGKLRWG